MITKLEEQYPTYEQSVLMKELGIPQDTCFATWGYIFDNIPYLHQNRGNSYSKDNMYEDEVGYETIDSNSYSRMYKSPTISQMEQFVFDCKENWIPKRYPTTTFNNSYTLPTRETNSKHYNYGKFNLYLGLHPHYFDTLSQAWAALCIFILENFKAKKQ